MLDCQMATSFSNRRFFFFLPGLFPRRIRLLFSRMDFFQVDCYCMFYVEVSRQGVDWAWASESCLLCLTFVSGIVLYSAEAVPPLI